MGTTSSLTIPANTAVSVADALFTSTQKRVLGIIFGQPHRSFFATELFTLAGGGRGAVQRELARLVSAGLVTMHQVGAQKHYQANRAAPIFEELRAIVRKTVGLIDPVRGSLKPLARKIELAFVYGSVARGEERGESDVDLLIVSDDLTLEQVLRRLVPVEAVIGRKINPTIYSRRDYSRRNGNSFLRKVTAGKRIVLIGEDEDANP